MLLELKDTAKSFGGVKALKPVNFQIRENEVVGLVGENGAGKSTLMRILSGVYQPDAGQMYLHGKPVSLNGPAAAYAHGIGMVFQEQSLILNLSVAENIFLGNERQFTRLGRLSKARLHAATRRQLAKVGLDIDPTTSTGSLTFAQRQMVELAKVLTLEELTNQRLLILLDEPTSVLEKAEIDVLFSRIRGLRSRASFIFVSHRLDEVLAISDRVYVMKDGEIVLETEPAATTIKQLHQQMVGRAVQSEYYREEEQVVPGQTTLLEAKNLSVAGCYANVSFALRAGEVLGIAGVVGSGREDLIRTLFGYMPQTGGTIEVEGRPVQLSSPTDAARHKIGYVPRERRVEGLVMQMSVSENISLPNLPSVKTHGVLNRGKEVALGQSWVSRLTIRPGDPNARCAALSGGNQQKVVLAKWVNAGVKVLILDHPTRGLDVGAKEDVYKLLRELTRLGVGVLLTADTLEETIGLSSQVLVMKDGKVTARFQAPSKSKPTQAELIANMV